MQKNIFTKFASIYNKNFDTLGKEGMYLNRIKAIYDRPTANTIANSEKLNVILLRSEIKQGCPLSPLLFNIVFEL